MQFSATYGAPGISPSLFHTLSFPLLASSQHDLPISQCSWREVSRLLSRQDAANRLSHSPQSPSCLQLQFPVKEIPVQAAEMPLLQWLSFQNILPVPDMVRRAFMNEAQKPK
ncbi:hypothetical protein HKD37_06G014759 [Glycine soja]